MNGGDPQGTAGALGGEATPQTDPWHNLQPMGSVQLGRMKQRDRGTWPYQLTTR